MVRSTSLRGRDCQVTTPNGDHGRGCSGSFRPDGKCRRADGCWADAGRIAAGDVDVCAADGHGDFDGEA
jgi:hypothetical protein